MSTEGDIYQCSWNKEGDEYVVMLQDYPFILARGQDLELIREDICKQIIFWNGDGEAVLEIVPPIDDVVSHMGDLLYSEAVYNDKVFILNKEGLFGDGYCRKCGYAIGRRTESPIEVSSKPKGVVCGVTGLHPVMKIYSSKFIALFSEQAKTNFITRPVLYNEKDSGYVELIPKEMIDNVGVKGGEYLTTFLRSWRCSECSREVFTAAHDDYEYGTLFIERSSLKENQPEVLFVNTSKSISLVIRNDIRSDLSSKKEAKKLCTDPVVVLTSRYIDRPVGLLPEPEKFDWV